MELGTIAVSLPIANFVKNLSHRDFSAEQIEVNAWHDHGLFVREARLSRMEQRRGTGTSELSRRGLFFTLAVDKANSLNDIRDQL